MPVRARIWRRRPITLTPLIDVIFLLLLFFMLSSTFTRFAEVPLQNAGGGAEPGPRPIFLQLGPEAFRLNGAPVGDADLIDALTALRPDKGEPTTLLVTLSEDVTSQRLIDLLVMLRPVPWLAVSVLG